MRFVEDIYVKCTHDGQLLSTIISALDFVMHIAFCKWALASDSDKDIEYRFTEHRIRGNSHDD